MALIPPTLTYVGDGIATVFTAPTVDLTVSLLEVFLDGVIRGEPTHYSYDNITDAVTFVAAPAVGVIVDLKRVTDVDERKVDFSNAAILTESILDTDSKQALYKIQELEFEASGGNTLTKVGGVWDAQGTRLTDVADPVDPQDAVTKAALDAQTHVSTDITDFNAAVEATGLDDLAVPTGPLNLNSQVINNVAAPIVGTDGANLTTVTDGDTAVLLAVDNDTDLIHDVAGEWDAVTKKVVNVVDGTSAQDAVTKNQLDTQTHVAADVTDFDTQVQTSKPNELALMDGTLNANNNFVGNVNDPTLAQHAATKAYVDANSGSGEAGVQLVTTATYNVDWAADAGKTLLCESNLTTTINLGNPTGLAVGKVIRITHKLGSTTLKRTLSVNPGVSGTWLRKDGIVSSTDDNLVFGNYGDSITVKALNSTTWGLVEDNGVITSVAGFNPPEMIKINFSYDVTGGVHTGTVGSKNLAFIPANSRVVNGKYHVRTNFASGTNTATMEFGISFTDDEGLIANTIITDAAFDSGWRNFIPNNVSQNDFTLPAAAAQWIRVNVGVETITTGRLYGFLDVIVGGI